SLAQYHAKTWDSPELGPEGRYGWFQEIIPSLQAYMQRSFEPARWQYFVASPRGAATSVQFHNLDWAVDSVERLLAFSTGLRLCIVHADTHLGNLYEDLDGTPGFFDSLPTKAPSMVEVSYHLTCGLDTADRPRWERSLVQHYLEELARHGVAA